MQSFDVVIGDYFQRHNLEDLRGLLPDAALARAVADGLEVACLVRAVLDSLSIAGVLVHSAREFSELPPFAENLQIFEELFRSDEMFAAAIELGTDTFLRRLAPDRLHLDAARKHSRQYQLEELALFALLADNGYSANVYPGAHMPVLKELVAGSLIGTFPRFESLTLFEVRPGSTP